LVTNDFLTGYFQSSYTTLFDPADPISSGFQHR
jgi:hypothetical protein